MAKYYAVERSSDYLAHHGVIGMRWGVHKNRNHSDRLKRVAQTLGTSAGVAGAVVGSHLAGTAGGFAGGAIGGATGALLGGLGYYATHRKQLKQESGKSKVTSVHENRETTRQREIWHKIDKMENDFYNNDELLKKHQKACARQDAKRYANQFEGGYKEAYRSYYNGYRHGDLDQGRSYEHYINSNPEAKKKRNALYKQYAKLRNG